MDQRDYSERAAYCQDMARQAPDRKIRESWLFLADMWTNMAASELSLNHADDYDALPAVAILKQMHSTAR